MSPRTARILVIASTATFLAVVAAAVWWPTGDGSADLEAVAAISTTTGASTSTTTEPVVPQTVPMTTTTTAPLVPGRLRIPALGVDAPVVPVGLNPDGSMEIPGAAEVGWYELGVTPGAPSGSAVLAAHVDYAGQRGVFFDLRSLPEGAEVFVQAPDGRELRFVVDQRFQVDKDELPGEELFRAGGEPTLTLITCGGAFDRSVRSYRDNIVVRAAPT